MLQNDDAGVQIDRNLHTIRHHGLRTYDDYSQVPNKQVGPNKRVSRVVILSKFHKRVGPNKQVGWKMKKVGSNKRVGWKLKKVGPKNE